MPTVLQSTLTLFPFTLCVTCSLAVTPFSIEADQQRLAPGQSATLTAGGTNGGTPGWNVIAGGCACPSSGEP